MKITFGSDPELHLFDREENKIVSSLRVLPRKNKDHPIQLGDGIRMYPDNVLIEAAHPPAESIDEIVALLKSVWTRMQERLTYRFSLLPIAAHVYDKSQLMGKRCWETGCNPSSNAYTRKTTKPADFTDGLRTGSFHLHIGHPGIDKNSQRRELVKLLDIYLGCASIIFDKDTTSPLRRALYGKAGEYRPTPYGVEYRVMGNYALRSPTLTRLAWELAFHAIDQFNSGQGSEIIEACGEERIQAAINNNRIGSATGLLEVAALPSHLFERVKETHETSSFNKDWGI